MYTNIDYFLLNENIQQAKSILSKLELDPNTETDYQKVVKLLDKTPNLIGKFVDLRYNKKESMDDIEKVINWILTNRNVVGRLPKNILQYNTIEELNDDIVEFNRLQNIKTFYNSLYRSMKEKIEELNNDGKKKFDDLASSFMNLSKEKREQFTPLKYFERNNITLTDFMVALETFIEKNVINDDKGMILEKIKEYGDRVKIKYNKNNILVVQTEDNDAVCGLGSQSWCIVYGSDQTRTSYFGIETYNTQYIVFNFNLPSTSSNSQFGITVKVDGTVSSGASQDKKNHYIPLEDVLEITGLPDNVLIPDEDKKRIGDGIRKIIDDYADTKSSEWSLINTFNKIKELDLEQYELQILKKIKSRISSFFMVTGSDMNLNVLALSLYNDISKMTIDESIPFMNQYISYLRNENLIVDQMFFGLISYIYKDLDSMLKTYIIYFNNNDINTRSRVVSTLGSIYSYYDISELDNLKKVELGYLKKITSDMNISYADDDFLIHIQDGVKKVYDNIISDFLEKANDQEWDTYKNFYDKYQLSKDEYPYEYLFDNNLINNLLEFNLDNDNFIKFLEEYVIPNKKISDLIIDALETSEGYGLLDNRDADTLVELCEKYDDYPTGFNDVIDVFFYKNSSKANVNIKDKLNIDTSSDGQDYVLLSDYTDFDDIIFDEPYFKNMEDSHDWTEWQNYDDTTLNDYYGNLDYYNVVSICGKIDENEITSQYINYDLVNKYVNDKEKMESLLNISDDNVDLELLKLLKSDLEKLLFDVDLESEENEDIYYIKDEIKDEIINRSINYAYEGSLYDAVWNKLIYEVEDVMGGGDWKRFQDTEVNKLNSGSPYRFMNNNLEFTIDLEHILDNIGSYHDIYYELGDSFEWEDLVKYKVDYDGKRSVDMQYIDAYPSNKQFNQSVRDNLY
jgi:hypothetical protein